MVMRLALPGNVAAQLAALPASPCTLSLALARDDGNGLVNLPIMEHGHLVWSPEEPGQAVSLQSAAWESFRSQRCLLWRSRPKNRWVERIGDMKRQPSSLQRHSDEQLLLIT